jgi:hypothetical protein
VLIVAEMYFISATVNITDGKYSISAEGGKGKSQNGGTGETGKRGEGCRLFGDGVNKYGPRKSFTAETQRRRRREPSSLPAVG